MEFNTNKIHIKEPTNEKTITEATNRVETAECSPRVQIQRNTASEFVDKLISNEWDINSALKKIETVTNQLSQEKDPSHKDYYLNIVKMIAFLLLRKNNKTLHGILLTHKEASISNQLPNKQNQDEKINQFKIKLTEQYLFVRNILANDMLNIMEKMNSATTSNTPGAKRNCYDVHITRWNKDYHDFDMNSVFKEIKLTDYDESFWQSTENFFSKYIAKLNTTSKDLAEKSKTAFEYRFYKLMFLQELQEFKSMIAELGSHATGTITMPVDARIAFFNKLADTLYNPKSGRYSGMVIAKALLDNEENNTLNEFLKNAANVEELKNAASNPTHEMHCVLNSIIIVSNKIKETQQYYEFPQNIK